MSQRFTITVNGKSHTITADPDMPLLYALRDELRLNNPHFGCGLAQCRNDADDCAMDAAVLAKAVGKPVRLQYMREQGTGWDPKGPASIHRARAALDATGRVTAYEFTSKGFSRVDVNTNGGKPHDTLCGQTLGVALKSGDGFGVPAESYAFDNKRLAWETIPPLLDRSSPL